MEPINLEVPTAEELAKHFSALTDSVNLINELVAANEHSAEADARAWANWKHVEIMLDKDFIKNDGRDLSVFQAAVTAGAAFAPNQPEA
jgi:hypothetical protein